MAFCTNCGKEIADGVKFCTHCGAAQQPAHMEYGQAGSGQTIPGQGDSFQGQTPQDGFGAASGPSASQAADPFGSSGSGTGNSYASYGSASAGYTTGVKPEPVPSLSFMEAVKTCFSKYATFEGRARRSEYWYWILFNIIVSLVLGFIGNMIFGAPENGGSNMLQTIYSLAVLVPGLAVFWRRMHDIGKSGAWFFLNLIPLIGSIIILVFAVRDSEPGENQYGMSPKYPV